MKIVLIILGIIICVFLLLIFLPLTVDLSYDENFILKIKFSGITFFDNEKRVNIKSKRKSKKKSKEKAEGSSDPKENFLKKTYKQKGLLGSISYFSEIFVLAFKRLWWVIKHFKFRKFRLNLTIATSDAANTAINYGKICGAVYPAIAFLESNANFKSKEINISTDFDKTNAELKVQVSVTTRILFWIIAAISALLGFLKLQSKEREKYER